MFLLDSHAWPLMDSGAFSLAIYATPALLASHCQSPQGHSAFRSSWAMAHPLCTIAPLHPCVSFCFPVLRVGLRSLDSRHRSPRRSGSHSVLPYSVCTTLWISLCSPIVICHGFRMPFCFASSTDILAALLVTRQLISPATFSCLVGSAWHPAALQWSSTAPTHRLMLVGLNTGCVD